MASQIDKLRVILAGLEIDTEDLPGYIVPFIFGLIGFEIAAYYLPITKTIPEWLLHLGLVALSGIVALIAYEAGSFWDEAFFDPRYRPETDSAPGGMWLDRSGNPLFIFPNAQNLEKARAEAMQKLKVQSSEGLYRAAKRNVEAGLRWKDVKKPLARSKMARSLIWPSFALMLLFLLLWGGRRKSSVELLAALSMLAIAFLSLMVYVRQRVEHMVRLYQSVASDDTSSAETAGATVMGTGGPVKELKRFQQEVRDAVELLGFAIESGRNVSDSIVERIKKAENFLNASNWPEDAQRSEFEKTYRDLAMFMKPVTIATLRATTDPDVKGFFNRLTFRTNSPAKRYSKKFWLLVILCTILIIVGQAAAIAYPEDKPLPDSKWRWFIYSFRSLRPFLYGWLGALVYLLRSAHEYLADSSFDPKRVPEYYNRMLLGFISGGVVLMFGSFTGKEAAASFIVGYNTDYLFQALERVANAIFPKDKGDQVAKPGIGSVVIDASSKVVAPGKSGNAAVTLNVPALAGGVGVTLATNDPLTIPPSLTISEGKTSAQFTFSVAPTAAEGTAVITATAPDGSSASSSVQIKNP